MRDENGQVTGKLKGYNTDGMGYWQGLKEEGIDFKGMKMVLIGTGGAATAIAVRGALDESLRLKSTSKINSIAVGERNR